MNRKDLYDLINEQSIYNGQCGGGGGKYTKGGHTSKTNMWQKERGNKCGKVGGLQVKKLGMVVGKVTKQTFTRTIRGMREHEGAKDNEGREQPKPKRGRQSSYPLQECSKAVGTRTKVWEH